MFFELVLVFKVYDFEVVEVGKVFFLLYLVVFFGLVGLCLFVVDFGFFLEFVEGSLVGVVGKFFNNEVGEEVFLEREGLLGNDEIGVRGDVFNEDLFFD